jgi:uroporphyrin-III C-methyltransferase
MALKHLAIISGTLMAHGRPPEEAVAIVGSATLPEQRVLETTLGRCAQAAQDAGLTPPCLVVVGEVVRLRDGLDWQGALAGKVLVSDPLKRRGRQEAG